MDILELLKRLSEAVGLSGYERPVRAFIREVFGAGTITLFAIGSFDGTIEIPGLSESPARVIALATGALLVMGYLQALFNWMSARRAGERGSTATDGAKGAAA